MGYLSSDGRYINEDMNDLSTFQRRGVIDDNHPDFAETVSGSMSQPVIYGLTKSEIFQELWDAVRSGQNWREIAEGAASYPADIYWFGYGAASFVGALGDIHEERVKATLNRTRLLLEYGLTDFGDIILENLPEREIVYDAYQGSVQRISATRYKTQKLLFMGNVFVNYMIHGGALGTIGRNIGGYATRYLASRLLQAGLLRIGVPITARTLRTHPWFRRSFFYTTTIGAIVRRGEREHDANGDVERMQLFDVLVTILTGKADIDETRQFYRNLERQHQDGARRLYEAVSAATIDSRVMQRGTPLSEIYHELDRVHSGFVHNQTFYEGVIELHNISIRLKRLGFEHPLVDSYIKLGDPTIMHWLRLFFFGMMAVSTDLMGVPAQTAWWDRALREEGEVGQRINNP